MTISFRLALMFSKFAFMNLHCFRKQLLPTLLLLLCAVAPLSAEQKYLTPGHPDGIALLAPPPMPGSPEYAADLASARAVSKGRTAEEEARAKNESLTIFNFAPAIGEFFQQGKFPKTETFFTELKPDIKATIDHVKTHWNRQRPYEVDSSLKFGKPEPSSSYPSGHSTVGMVQALLLAELFPEKREAILQIGRGIGWNRVVIGKHFPTDVHAGRVLAQAIVRELMASSSFQKDFAEVKAELQAAKDLATNQAVEKK